MKRIIRTWTCEIVLPNADAKSKPYVNSCFENRYLDGDGETVDQVMDERVNSGSTNDE